jgi:hypothetical protein
VTEFFIPFMLGFLGSGHCLGMCGPLVLAFSMQEGNPSAALSVRNSFRHHLAFQSGRLLTYGLLGGLAAGMFQFASLYHFFQGLRGGVTLAGGFLMMVFGLMLLRLVPTPAFLGSDRMLPDGVRRQLPVLMGSKKVWAKMVLGLLAGFMPCGLSWGMIVVAAITRDMTAGILIMTAFGLGTAPALLAVGLFSSVISLRMRLAGERLAACGLLFMGIFMVVKGGVRLLA